MALRTLVTGSDMCSAGGGADGAGPSNAVGALVNQLLGTAKTQETLRDVSAGGRGMDSRKRERPSQLPRNVVCL